MIVQGLGAGKSVDANLDRVLLAGDRATALALVFTELLQNALEHGGNRVRIELGQSKGGALLLVSDDGAGMGDASFGTGLSIVEALVRDELHGTLTLTDERGGLRAEVVFPP